MKEEHEKTEEEVYQEHYSPDGEYIEYLMEHPELQTSEGVSKTKGGKSNQHETITSLKSK